MNNVIQIGNPAAVVKMVLGGPQALDANTIAAANASLFNQAYMSEPLTAYAQGWRDPANLEEFLEFLCPEVPVPKRFEFRKGTNAESFLSEDDDVRAIGADFKRVKYTTQLVSSRTHNKGLVVYVDLDYVEGTPNWEQSYTAMLMKRLLRNEVRRAVTGLSNAANSTAKTWNSASDPDTDLLDAFERAGDAEGLESNRVLLGRGAAIKRLKAYRAQNNAGGYASALLTMEQLAAYLGVDEVRQSRERYQSSASAKSKIVGDIAIAFNAESGQTTEDPSNIKRFVSPVESGGKFRVFRQELSAKIVAITVEHNSNIVVTDTSGVEKIVVS